MLLVRFDAWKLRGQTVSCSLQDAYDLGKNFLRGRMNIILFANWPLNQYKAAGAPPADARDCPAGVGVFSWMWTFLTFLSLPAGAHDCPAGHAAKGEGAIVMVSISCHASPIRIATRVPSS